MKCEICDEKIPNGPAFDVQLVNVYRGEQTYSQSPIAPKLTKGLVCIDCMDL